MSVDRKDGRRKGPRAFRPTLDGQAALEPRLLMSKLPGKFFLEHPKPGVAYVHKQPPLRSGTHAHEFPIAVFPRGPRAAVETAHGGQSVVVAAPDGSHFLLSLSQFIPTPPGSSTATATGTTPGETPIQGVTPGSGAVQPIGTVRAYPLPNGQIGIILDGTNSQSELDISPYPFKQRKGYAHSFAYGQTNQSHLLNIGQIVVNSGVISAINGYHTADLAGPLVISGNQPVDRLSFDALKPGASITTGGDLNTLDILNGVNLNSGPGIHVGRDLNLINVGQDLNLSNGASLFVGRFLGTTPQPPKGTATGSNFLAINQALVGTGTSTTVASLAGYIQGNLILGTGSTLTVVNGIANSSLIAGQPVAQPSILLINGALNAASVSQINIPNVVASTTIQPGVNLVARAGFQIPGVSIP